MFGRLFDRAAPLWRAAATLGDIIVVNFLLLLTAIPVVTLGAGLTATYDAARRVQADLDDGAARTFWRSFRSNFVHSSALWAIVGAVGAGVLASWLYLPVPELAIIKTLITTVYLLIFPFVWAVQARFENAVLRTLRNAVAIAVARLPFAAGVLLIQAVVGAVTVATWIMLPQAVALLLLLGYPLAVWASVPLIERALAPLLPPVESESHT